MADDKTAVDAEIAAAVAEYSRSGGTATNVAAVCRELGIGRTTFYKYVKRFEAVGVEGFFPRSRRPRSAATQVRPEVIELILSVREAERHAGFDYGASAVRMRLEELPDGDPADGCWPGDIAIPSRATLNRIFHNRGVLRPTPQRRPRHPARRFERERVNDLWQYDGFQVKLANGTAVVVLHLTDDCSRTDLALQVVSSENSADVWSTFALAAERYGLPREVLTDNGTAFSGARRGWQSAFEDRLIRLGVRPLTTKVGSPQTNGKNERAHQRVRKWLAHQPTPVSLPELQDLLEVYRAEFNTRRNPVLRGLSPAERFELGPVTGPQGAHHRTHVGKYLITDRGGIGVNGKLIAIGRRFAGQTAVAFVTGDHVVAFVDNVLVVDLIIDPARRYQPRRINHEVFAMS